MYLDIEDRKINNVEELYIAVDEFLNDEALLYNEAGELWETVLNSFSPSTKEEYENKTDIMTKSFAEKLFTKFDSFEVLGLELNGYKNDNKIKLMKLQD